MARYVHELVLNKPDDFVHFIMNDFLQKNQFERSDWKGEPVFRAGDAMVEGYKYLKWSYAGGVFHIEAWLKGVTGKEMDLDGVVGAFNKKPYKESLEQLYVVLLQPIPNQVPPQQQMNPNPIPVQTVDNTGAATMAMVFGVISIITAFIIPIVSIILACLGFSRARMGANSSMGNRAKTGKTCCIVGLVLAIVMWVFNIVLLMA